MTELRVVPDVEPEPDGPLPPQDIAAARDLIATIAEALTGEAAA